MEAARRLRGAAAIAGALATGAVALAPGASAAAPTHSCGNKTLAVKVAEPGAPGSTSTTTSTIHVLVRSIKTQGVSCTAAGKFLTTLYGQGQGPTPEGYACKFVKLKAPPGTVPTVCTKPGKKIQYFAPGG